MALLFPDSGEGPFVEGLVWGWLDRLSRIFHRP